MSQLPKGKVPNYSMRPNPIGSIVCIIIFISGSLISLSFFSQEDGTGVYQHKGKISAMITGLLTFFFLLVATDKFWFTHLWKKNSTHGRHEDHSDQHPLVQQKQFQKWLMKKRKQNITKN